MDYFNHCNFSKHELVLVSGLRWTYSASYIIQLGQEVCKLPVYIYLHPSSEIWLSLWRSLFHLIRTPIQLILNTIRYLAKAKILVLIPGHHWEVWFTGKDLDHGWTNPGRHVAQATKFYTVAHNVFCFLVW